MKKSLKTWLFITLILGLSLSACAPKAESDESTVYLPLVGEQSELEEAPEALDLFPDKAQVVYAQGFSIDYYDTYKVVTVTQPWQGASEGFTYVLVMRGSQVPGVFEGAQVIEIPVRSIVTMSTTYFPHLEMLGVLESLVAVDDATYVFNERVQQRASAGEIAVVGGGAGGGAVNVEMLLELAPELIMTSASGVPEYDAHPALIEAGLPVVINADYLESSPLGRAEWGKFIAAFYNLEDEANRQFEEVASSYLALKEQVSALSARPTVFTNTDFQGSWYVPGGESYAAILLRDAGADYLWADTPGTGANPLAFEEVFDEAKEANFWLNVGFAGDLASLLMMDERYADFDAYAEGRVYNYNKRVNANGGMDYFESGTARPDLVLADLVAIFHPGLLPEHDFYYYQQLQ